MFRFDPKTLPKFENSFINFNTTLVSVRHKTELILIRVSDEFQYNTCFGSTKSFIKKILIKSNFNTTLVSVRHLFKSRLSAFKAISIQHLFRFDRYRCFLHLFQVPISIQHLFRFDNKKKKRNRGIAPISIQHLFRFDYVFYTDKPL